MRDRELMTINDKDFKVKNGLQVAGTASFDSDVVIDTIRVAYDSTNQRLKAYIDNAWHLITIDSDIPQTIDGGTISS